MNPTPSSDRKGGPLPAALAPDTHEDRLSHEGRNQVLFNLNIVWNLFIFCCFVSACRLHARVDSSFAIQTAIATQLTSSVPLSQSPVTSLAAAVSQLEGLASLADYAVNVSGVAEVGLHNRLIGGIRLAQSRYGVEPCPAGAEIYRNLGPRFYVDCVGDTESAASFGAALDPALANASLARAFQYRPPISAIRSTLAASLPFYAVLPYNGLLPGAVAALLRSMGWVDRLTKVVDLYMVLLNPGLNAVTEVSITYAIASGGQITANLQVLTLWFLPFTGGATVAGLDVVICIIVACLALELAGRLAYALHGILVREPASRALFCRRRLLPCHVVSGVTLDALAASLLLAITVLWSQFIRRISAAQASIEASAWSDDSYEADTLRMHEHVTGLSDLYSVVRTLALLNICALGIKIIFAFSFSTRLGSLHRAFGRALPDMGAAGLLVALVMAIFAVCGQILYGAAVPMWSDTLSAGLALFLELNGENQTSQMIATSPRLTPIFYGAFYVVVQSTLLVVMFAIVGDNYSQVRQEIREDMERADQLDSAHTAAVYKARLSENAFTDMLAGCLHMPVATRLLRRRLCGVRSSGSPGLCGRWLLCCGVDIRVPATDC